jgi:hypothetical protein
MDAHGKSTEASLLQPREGAGKYWWETFVRTHISEINRRFNQAKALYIPNLESSLVPLDLFSYVREAALCFEIGRYLAAILLASKSVELIMARDTRTRAHPELRRAADNTITLCSRNLVIARKLGLPVDRLLSPEEVLNPEAPILFADRAARVNTGSVTIWFSAISEYVALAEKEALDQLEKAQRFLVGWFNEGGRT